MLQDVDWAKLEVIDCLTQTAIEGGLYLELGLDLSWPILHVSSYSSGVAVVEQHDHCKA